MKNEKIEILNEMIENGYHMMGRTVEQMAEMFTVDDLKMFRDSFLKWKG